MVDDPTARGLAEALTGITAALDRIADAVESNVSGPHFWSVSDSITLDVSRVVLCQWEQDPSGKRRRLAVTLAGAADKAYLSSDEGERLIAAITGSADEDDDEES